MIKGRIFDISRFRLDDGPGIRTVIFLKGCPLRCKWCHNPESFRPEPELMFYAQQCISCGKCTRVCEFECHAVVRSAHVFNREHCTACGKCEQVCPVGALKMVGRVVSANDVLKEAIKDRCFYQESGGGVTLSGGEPLMQPAFSIEMAKRLKQQGIGVCVETSGYGQTRDILELARYTDLFLFDYKGSPEKHRAMTGKDFDLIKKNLEALNAEQIPVELRCPIVPGIHDHADHFKAIADLVHQYSTIISVVLEPYHPLGVQKCAALGAEAGYASADFLDADAILPYIEWLCANVKVPVRTL